MAASKKPLVNYTTDVQHLVVEKCSPCHIAGKGNKLSLDNYDALKTNIDEVLVRIEKNPGEHGFMPMKRAKLSDSTITVFKTWKADGFVK